MLVRLQGLNTENNVVNYELWRRRDERRTLLANARLGAIGGVILMLNARGKAGQLRVQHGWRAHEFEASTTVAGRFDGQGRSSPLLMSAFHPWRTLGALVIPDIAPRAVCRASHEQRKAVE